MDHVACEAGMDFGGMSGAGGDSGDEWEAMRALLHEPLTFVQLVQIFPGKMITDRPRQRPRGPSHKVPSGT